MRPLDFTGLQSFHPRCGGDEAGWCRPLATPPPPGNRSHVSPRDHAHRTTPGQGPLGDTERHHPSRSTAAAPPRATWTLATPLDPATRGRTSPRDLHSLAAPPDPPSRSRASPRDPPPAGLQLHSRTSPCDPHPCQPPDRSHASRATTPPPEPRLRSPTPGNRPASPPAASETSRSLPGNRQHEAPGPPLQPILANPATRNAHRTHDPPRARKSHQDHGILVAFRRKSVLAVSRRRAEQLGARPVQRADPHRWVRSRQPDRLASAQLHLLAVVRRHQ